jgi:hypothetical protein
MEGAGRRSGVNDFYAEANWPGPMSLVGPVSDTQMIGQVVQACVAELYGLFFSCSALIMRAMPDSRAASSRV